MRSIEVRRWLHIAQICLPAVIEAGLAGNVTCREATKELLSKNLIPTK